MVGWLFVKSELFAHQLEDISRFADEKVIALFNEMGTGKSATILRIAQHKYQKGEIDSLLVIAPNGVHAQWAHEEIPSWLDCQYHCQCLYGRGGLKSGMPFTDDGALQIVCINVDTFSTPKKWEDVVTWANIHKCFIVIDEATCIKNIKSKRTERILYAFNKVQRRGRKILHNEVRSVARAILTGTPVTNSPTDLWALMEFIQPGYFGLNYYAFQNRYAMFSLLNIENCNRTIPILINREVWQAIKSMNEYAVAFNTFGISIDTFNVIHQQTEYIGPYKHADELKRLIAPVASFRRLQDCVSMPKQNYIVRKLLMEPELRKAYESMRDEYLMQYEGITVTAQNKITMYTRLQQLCSGFIPYYTGELDDDGEIPEQQIQWIGTYNAKLDAMYNDIASLDKPIIVITRFTAEAQRIYNDLKDKYRCCLITGWTKVGSIEGFKRGEYDICIANMKVISKGFNLQIAYSMLFYSNDFSLENRLQEERRIWRLGQTTNCQYIDYQYTDTIDVHIIEVLTMKQSLLEYIRGGNVADILKV